MRARPPKHRPLKAAAAAPPAPQKPTAAAAPCKCQRNRCLRRYCACFARGTFCSAGCACSGCRNREEFVREVRSAIANVKRRYRGPYKDAFGAKTAPRGGAAGRLEHRRGCKCQRSSCLKRYCECFEAGVACGQHCKCVGCANPHGAAPPPKKGKKGKKKPGEKKKPGGEKAGLAPGTSGSPRRADDKN